MGKKIDKIFKTISHNRYFYLALLLALLFLLWILGCEPKVPSITQPMQKLTRNELQIEVDTYLALAKVRFEQLEKQEEFRRTIVNNAFIIAQGGELNPYGIITSFLSILGAGAVIDNRRKDKVIKDVKTELDSKNG